MTPRRKRWRNFDDMPEDEGFWAIAVGQPTEERKPRGKSPR